MTEPQTELEATAYRRDIDGLRACAVLAVVAFHAAARLAPGGFTGVDVFFVISGFLITRLIARELEAGQFSMASFYLRRVLRIFPALMLVMAAALVAGWLLLLPGEYTTLGRQAAWASAFGLNVLLKTSSSYFSPAAETQPLLHLWSLSVEEQFYVLWPPLLLIAWRARLQLGVVPLAAVAASFVASAFTLSSDPVAAFYLLESRMWELAVGGLVATGSVLVRNHATPSVRVRDIASVVGAGAMLGSFFLLSAKRAFPGPWALVPTLGAAAIIWAGPAAWFNRVVLSRKPLVALGLMSYPLYLWHWLLLSLVSVASGGNSTAVMKAAAVALAVGAAWATMTLVERPIRFGGSSGKLTGALLTVCLALVGCIGFMLTHLDPSSAPPARMAAVQVGVHVQRALSGTRQLRMPLDVYNPDLTHWRRFTCFLERHQSETDFADDCIDPAPVGAPTVFVWGDSHGATLAAGIRANQAKYKVRLAQFTSSACAPVLHHGGPFHPRCEAINELAMQRLMALRPDVVLLAAQWYDAEPLWLAKLAQTVALARAGGAKLVLVVGPAPMYLAELPSALLRAGRQEATRAQLPRDEPTNKRDQDLRAWAAREDIAYASVVDTLCDETDCLVRAHLDAEHDDVVQFDRHHLTNAGAAHVFEQLAPRFPVAIGK